jgi:hypothetical protein
LKSLSGADGNRASTSAICFQTQSATKRSLDAVNDSPTSNYSWFKSFRHPDVDELKKLNPLAFVLADTIARRAQWKSGFNKFNLQPGEALIGDHDEIGLSEQQYRTAKNQLAKFHFATFRTTNRGTIAKLCDTRLFDPLNTTSQRTEQRAANVPANDQPTTGQRLPRKLIRLKEGGTALDLSLAHRDAGLLVKDKTRLQLEIGVLQEGSKPDRKQIIAGLRSEIKRIEAEFKRRAPQLPEPKAEVPAKPVQVLTGGEDGEDAQARLKMRQQWQQAVNGDRPDY